MRIIAGLKKGIKLKMVPGKHVRPTSDRVKESIFQVLGPYFSGGVALDLFAGSGQLGLEALSRGMDFVYFVDKSLKSIQTIKQNIALTQMEAKTKVLKMDAFSACRLLSRKGEKIDILFLDPPYHQQLILPILQEISKQRLLSPKGRVIAELSKHETIPEKVGTLIRKMNRGYGSTSIMIYQESILGSKEEQS